MNGLSLFTGSGIGELAFKIIFKDYGYRTIGYVEIDRYCRSIIRARIRDGILDDAPIFDDIRDFNRRYASLYAGRVDWLSGGFPCQPFSVAGRRLGEADERNMWPATRDAISIIRPGYVFLENVPGIGAYRYTVTADISRRRYGCEWDTVPAGFVGTEHLRERWWLVANANHYRLEGRNKQATPNKGSAEQLEAHDGSRCRPSMLPTPRVLRRVNDVAYTVDRLRAIGNGWVPQVVRRILSVA